jgi:hypothetical protein
MAEGAERPAVVPHYENIVNARAGMLVVLGKLVSNN